MTAFMLMLALAGCDRQPTAPTPGQSDVDQIESTLDAVESELAGD